MFGQHDAVHFIRPLEIVVCYSWTSDFIADWIREQLCYAARSAEKAGHQ